MPEDSFVAAWTVGGRGGCVANREGERVCLGGGRESMDQTGISGHIIATTSLSLVQLAARVQSCTLIMQLIVRLLYCAPVN